MLRISFHFGNQLPVLRTSLRAIGRTTQKSSINAANKTTTGTTSGNTSPNDVIKKTADGQGLAPDNPFIVASPTNKCIVGCTCEPESHTINWFYVNEGEPQTCSCGYFFKLDKVDSSSTWVPEYSRIMYVDERRVDPRLQKREGILQRLFSKGRKKAVAPPSMKNNTDNNKIKS